MTVWATVRAWSRALPALLRIGIAETLAYRVEFVIWLLTNSLPLIMLGLWTSVAEEAPFGRFGTAEFTAYYLAALIVRNITGSWVIWQINDEIRTGKLSARLLRPLHPFVMYAATHVASVPLRALVSVPFAAILLVATSSSVIATDPVLYAVFAVSLMGAWLLTFCSLFAIGSLGLFMDKSIGVYNLWLGIFAIASGYLVPLELLPTWAQHATDWAPFRYMLAFPVEVVTGVVTRQQALVQLAIQWGFVALMLAVALGIWQAGLRRYEAYGS